MQSFNMIFWTYGNDEMRTSMRSKEVLAPEQTLQDMVSKDRPRYLRFIIGEGETFYISADCVISLSQIYPGG
ncbi:hypothetical protein [Paucilactobacillus nenjiangensis]|uniref:Uncharacterized protein n=1 Tax=Paucilactobacillus nenjiangensis TaxID=1296540 RepID=A0A5P1X117_9LACO|nr:hypothetical protein [Paucilactobacillus nenjiangensis]QER67590.1 hypothetical protein F0161_06780 [Paucilactobacillus nenjiangensis]